VCSQKNALNSTKIITVRFQSPFVWANISNNNIAKSQSVQSFAAGIGTRKYGHTAPALRQINWLPVCYMLPYKDAVMTFKFPPYLSTRRKDELLCMPNFGQRFYTVGQNYGTIKTFLTFFFRN
jgi:hypothetical protein